MVALNNDGGGARKKPAVRVVGGGGAAVGLGRKQARSWWRSRHRWAVGTVGVEGGSDGGAQSV